MRILHFCCWLPCVLGACATSTPAGPPPSGEGLPRLSGAAEEPVGIVALPAPCGLAVVGNAADLHFRMELAGQHIGVRSDSPGATYTVDGLKVQVSMVAGRDMSPAAAPLTGIELLRMHARWETARLSEALGREVSPEELEILTAENMPSASIWWFPSSNPSAAASNTANPTPRDPAAAQSGADVARDTELSPGAASMGEAPPAALTGTVYLTAAFGHQVLALSVEALHGEARDDLVTKAKGWMATVTTSSDAISPEQVGEDLKAALASGQGCAGRPNAVVEAGSAPAPVEAKPTDAAHP